MAEPEHGLLQGRYRLEDAIGHGGMATVYRARDEQLGRDVAVKLFETSTADPAELKRQENELTVLARLSHHNVVTLLDAGVDHTLMDQPHLYLVMELLHGADLKKTLAAGPLSTRQAAEIGYDLAQGLEYIHDLGVVHRDIKPANILIADYNNSDHRRHAKLSDFGIAVGEDDALLTQDGATTGTAAYLSPEQALGKSIGAPSDVYSLGLVLLECLTGQLAFPGEPVQSALARLQHDPEVPEWIAPGMRELLIAMTSRNADERPHIREVILSLRQVIIADAGRHKEVDPDLLPHNELARMDAVGRYDLLDTPPDGAFDRITALAARVFSVPIAIVSVVDHDRIWFKSHHGTEVGQIGRDGGLCASAILSNEPWIVEQARNDPRALANPLVAGELGLQFYAGVPLRTSDGFNLGTLCVLDVEPRTVSQDEIETLRDLADMVMRELEMRLESRRLQASPALVTEAVPALS
ncbi:GAF domain-containing protein [Cryobacterium tepidiphilum]|uniref:GAF domain-containing protein n=2 Tax=Cryobacterium tepidiphilum TaxID=2486026 RepID=A0A3M8LAH9_9MICO|nr:GAF domain-containing protein [Cryobacterium tepidiphilum]